MSEQSFADIVSKCKVPTIEKINSGVRDAIDSSTIAAKEQEFRDRSIMMFKKAESKAPTKKRDFRRIWTLLMISLKKVYISRQQILSRWTELVDMRKQV